MDSLQDDKLHDHRLKDQYYSMFIYDDMKLNIYFAFPSLF